MLPPAGRRELPVDRNGRAQRGAGRPRAGALPVTACLCLALALGTVTARAATFTLPPPGERVVGAIKQVAVKPHETLLDIARQYDVGLNEITAANPGVDPWLPKVGTQVTIPNRYILPDAPREGIVVNLPEMRLYYYPTPHPGKPAVVVTHPLGIGAEGKTLPLGTTRIIEKIKDPTWYVPASIQEEAKAKGQPLPDAIPPGPDDPLGKFAMRLGWPSYLIHGTNHPYGIGMRVSHGCLRMYPEDIQSLFGQVAVDTPVRILDQPFKAGWEAGKLYLEAHAQLAGDQGQAPSNLTGAVSSVLAATNQPLNDALWDHILAIATRHQGIPVAVGLEHAQADKTPPATDRRSDASPMPGSPGQEGWFVQVGAYEKASTTRRVSHQVAELHMQITTGAPQDGSLCRILIGPFSDRRQATQRERQLQQATGIKGIVYPSHRYSGYAPCQSGSWEGKLSAGGDSISNP